MAKMLPFAAGRYHPRLDANGSGRVKDHGRDCKTAVAQRVHRRHTSGAGGHRDVLVFLASPHNYDSYYFSTTTTLPPNELADATIVVNGKVTIDLVQSVRLKSKHSIAIIPVQRVKKPETTELDGVPIYLVSLEDYKNISTEVMQIYSEYCQDGMNFGNIPYTWFPNIKLIEIIHNYLWDTTYFQEKLASEHAEVGTDWSKENSQ